MEYCETFGFSDREELEFVGSGLRTAEDFTEQKCYRYENAQIWN